MKGYGYRQVRIGLLLAVCLGAWIVVSPPVWMYWTFNPSERPTRQERLMCFIFVGTLVGLTGLCAAAFEAALFFLPTSWGGFDEDGEFVTMRHSLAGTLGFFASMFILWLLDKRETLSKENEELRKELENRDNQEEW